MDYDKISFREVEKKDIEYLRKVLDREKDKIVNDSDYGGWCIGTEYAVDYLYNNENTILNPKELEGWIDEIIEDELEIGV